MFRYVVAPALLASAVIAYYYVTPDADRGPMIPATWSNFAGDSHDGDFIRVGMRNAAASIMDKWQENDRVVEGRVFSRFGDAMGRSRKLDAYTQFDLHQPDPDNYFTGTLNVQNPPDYGPSNQVGEFVNRFAFVVDRKNGLTRIFAEGRWMAFDQWLVAKPGVH